MSALIFLLLTYFVAAVPFGLVVALAQGGELDPRYDGSGNVGATNAARLYGWRVGLVVLALDVGKGWLPVWLAAQWWPGWGAAWTALVAWLAFLAHCFPVYLSFRGGKGVATSAGAMLALAPGPTAAALVLWAVVLRLGRRSSVASLVATAALVGLTASWRVDALPAVLGLALGVFVMHTSNLRRLVAGQEAPVIEAARARVEVDVRALLGQGPAGGPPPVERRAGREGEGGAR